MGPQNLHLQDEILLSSYVIRCDQLQGKNKTLMNKGGKGQLRRESVGDRGLDAAGAVRMTKLGFPTMVLTSTGSSPTCGHSVWVSCLALCKAPSLTQGSHQPKTNISQEPKETAGGQESSGSIPHLQGSCKCVLKSERPGRGQKDQVSSDLNLVIADRLDPTCGIKPHMESLCPVGENVKWYSHCGKQCGGFSKN